MQRRKPVGRDRIASLLCLCILICACLPVCADEIVLDDYQKGLGPKWIEKSFKGKTHYQVAREDGQLCIKATSRSSASALYYKIKYNLQDYPILTWRWKVDRVLARGSALHKDGDDYAARVYVVFPSLLFWKTRALNYIWANKLPIGQAVPNPFAANAVMIAVQSGPGLTGKWVEETRNILEDYRRYFGTDPPNTGAIAIMTDTDNTGEEAVAWYGPIRILSAPDG
ncbi:MAG: DUF3047 domain-containing protein [Deltaproteobacteria bacterium]|jgi:hypothetical protein